jgi:hypothetical protein
MRSMQTDALQPDDEQLKAVEYLLVGIVVDPADIATATATISDIQLEVVTADATLIF